MKIVINTTNKKYLEILSFENLDTIPETFNKLSLIKGPLEAKIFVIDKFISCHYLSKLKLCIEKFNIRYLCIYSNNRNTILAGKSIGIHSTFVKEQEIKKKLSLFDTTNKDDILHEGTVRSGDAKEIGNKFGEFGMDKDMMRKIYAINGTNVLVNDTKGIQGLHETRELIIEAFNEVCKKGPVADEPVMGMMVRLVDAKLHEDAIHRGPAQTIPAVRNAIKGAMLRARTVLMEPMQRSHVSVPNDWLGQVTREITNRRGIIEDMPSEGESTTVIGTLPVAETFGFSNDIRAASQGRAIWNSENRGFDMVPPQLIEKVIGSIRERKGLKAEKPTESYYTD